jgi:hypothetical protein
MNQKRTNAAAAASIAVCSILVFIGIVRLLSYSQGAIGDTVRRSVFGFLCYDPSSVFSVQFFKILATPSVVALIYFFFRWRNAAAPSSRDASRISGIHRLDFKSPVLRGILTSVITVHWVAMEWWKFNIQGFYPWSKLENRALNIGVLIASQALAFWTMKYLSFEPLSEYPDGPEQEEQPKQ